METARVFETGGWSVALVGKRGKNLTDQYVIAIAFVYLDIPPCPDKALAMLDFRRIPIGDSIFAFCSPRKERLFHSGRGGDNSWLVYRGIFPCFFGGFLSRLFSSMANA